MQSLEHFSVMTSTIATCESIRPPILVHKDSLNRVINEDLDHLYNFQKSLYKSISNDFFNTRHEYQKYYSKELIEVSKTLDTFLKLMISFKLISNYFYWRTNTVTRQLITDLFRDIQNNCNIEDLYIIKSKLDKLINEDKLLTRYKNFILYQDLTFKKYNKTNKSKLDSRIADQLNSGGWHFHKKDTLDDDDDYALVNIEDGKITVIQKSSKEYEDHLRFRSFNFRNIVNRFNDKSLKALYGVIKVKDNARFTCRSLREANGLMKLYWQDKTAQSYKGQPYKTARRLHRLIKLQPRGSLLSNLKPSDIEKIIRESFDLSIYPN